MNTESSEIYCNQCGFKSASDADFCQNCGVSLRITSAFELRHELQSTGPYTPLPSPVQAVRYAGFWIRVVAALLDTFVVFVGLLPIRMLLGSTATLLGTSWQMPTAKIFLMGRMLRIGCAVVLAWLYRAGMESSSFQGTLGKMALQIKVVDLTGNRISFDRATARYLAKILSGITLGIGYLMVGFTPRKQGLHDRIAGTLVEYR